MSKHSLELAIYFLTISTQVFSVQLFQHCYFVYYLVNTSVNLFVFILHYVYLFLSTNQETHCSQ